MLEKHELVFVESAITPSKYNSFDNAISASNSIPKFNLDEVNGQFFKDYTFNGSELKILLENGKTIYVSPGKNKVEWGISSESFYKFNKTSDYYDFKFKSGEVLKWDWKMKLNSFIGKQIAISPSDNYLFMFYREGPEHIFSVLRDLKDKSRLFLYLSEV